jgi:cell division ATPase FtsA
MEVEAHLVTAGSTFVENVVKCVRRAHRDVEAVVLEPLASSLAVVTEDEKAQGAVLIDIGGGTTDIALFTGGSICYSAAIPVGGNHVTYDLSVGLRAPREEAERLKLTAGCALRDGVGEEEYVEVQRLGETEPRELPRRVLAEIIEPRMRELFDLVRQEIETALDQGAVEGSCRLADPRPAPAAGCPPPGYPPAKGTPHAARGAGTRAGYPPQAGGGRRGRHGSEPPIHAPSLRSVEHAPDRTPRLDEARGRCGGGVPAPLTGGGEMFIGGSVVLTGGGAQLPGTLELAREQLEMPARIGTPRNVGGLADAVDSPIFATAVGLVHYGAAQWRSRPHVPRNGSLVAAALERVSRFFLRLSKHS